jgi:hypothetical protein
VLRPRVQRRVHAVGMKITVLSRLVNKSIERPTTSRVSVALPNSSLLYRFPYLILDDLIIQQLIFGE